MQASAVGGAGAAAGGEPVPSQALAAAAECAEVRVAWIGTCRGEVLSCSCDLLLGSVNGCSAGIGVRDPEKATAKSGLFVSSEVVGPQLIS